MGVFDKLKTLFQPRSIAVIGAGRDPEAMNGRRWRNWAESFRGPLCPINPHAETIGGRRAFPSILSAPEPIDLAFIATPAAQVLDAARQCAEKGVQSLVVITAGFAESDSSGRSQQAELRAIVHSGGMRMVGPNCFGVFNTDPELGFNGTVSPAPPLAGKIGVCTQSGALGAALPEFLQECRLGIPSLVSLGNKADLTENDFAPQVEAGSIDEGHPAVLGVVSQPARTAAAGPTHHPAQADHRPQGRKHPSGPARGAKPHGGLG